jgi:UDP-N-acetyl-2-amino-2-deoxyglucuronate dehydrogenase
MKNFAIIGAGGYIAPRHVNAIQNTGNNLLACVDLNSNLNELKNKFPDVSLFNNFENFAEFIQSRIKEIDYIVVCSPNFLHFEHCSWALRLGIDVICEKPLTLIYDQFKVLQDLEKKYNSKVWCILQLRHHSSIKDLKNNLVNLNNASNSQVDLTYITPRDRNYLETWKGDSSKSGGILFNIGLHFFDMLIYVYGDVKSISMHHRDPHVLSGLINFETVNVRWFLSIIDKHSPYYSKKDNQTYRSITIDGKELDFSVGFNDLHTESYKDILRNDGFGIEDNKPVMRLLENINNLEIIKKEEVFHPYLQKV